MNNRKIAFITCVNDYVMYEECLKYINNLEIPEGYEIDIISIEEAESMSCAYNKAMDSTDATYKVYLHQDTLIINKKFISDILNVFSSDNKIGMIGMVGAEIIPSNAIWWDSDKKYGKVYESHTGSMELLDFDEVCDDYKEVKAIDGFIMITQFDIPWREDKFDGWYFYDVSQSVEFNLAGYKVVVPKQKDVWCIHECGISNINNYEKYRKKYIDEYMKYDYLMVIVPENLLELKRKIIDYKRYKLIIYNQFNDKEIHEFITHICKDNYDYYTKENFNILIISLIEQTLSIKKQNKLLIINNDSLDFDYSILDYNLINNYFVQHSNEEMIEKIEKIYQDLDYNNYLLCLKLVQQILNYKCMLNNSSNIINKKFELILKDVQKNLKSTNSDKHKQQKANLEGLKINNKTRIYILTPMGKTGGIELLYQLCDNLIKKGFDANILYNVEINTTINNVYPEYSVKIEGNIEDQSDNILIVPEVFTEYIYKYDNIQKIIWWLSVDNYEVSKSYNISEYLLGFKKVFDVRNVYVENIEMHLVQSEYAKQFLNNHGIFNVKPLKDYLNGSFFEKDQVSIGKQDYILYNPKKGFEFTKKIIMQSLDLNWIPIENMTAQQVAELLRNSKVYIDFGNHPGKDRIPREAAISGCCIITGKRGAAKYREDIDIDDEFKFDDIEENIPKIIEKIKQCIKFYHIENDKFTNYRKKIFNEYNQFKKDIDLIFGERN